MTKMKQRGIDNEVALRQLLKELPIKNDLKIKQKPSRIPSIDFYFEVDGELEIVNVMFSGMNKCKRFIRGVRSLCKE